MIPLSPLRLPSDATHETARTYLLVHDTRVKKLDSRSPEVLNQVWREGLRMSGKECLMGGPQSKDELVNYIADMEFPDAARAREIYHMWLLTPKPDALYCVVDDAFTEEE
jgi:hypothetical protein